MRVMLYESDSTNHETYIAKSVVLSEDGTYQFITHDDTTGQTIVRSGKWDNRVVVDKEQAT